MALRINLAKLPEIRALLADLREEDWSHRRRGARGLVAAVRQERIPAKTATKALKAAVDHDTGIIAVTALAALAPLEWASELHARLLTALREGHPATQVQASDPDICWAGEVLAQSGAEDLVRSACESATALASDGNPRFVQTAVDVLDGLRAGGSAEATRPLEMLVRHAKPFVQKAARVALMGKPTRLT